MFVQTRAYEVTGIAEWVAGRRVKAGDILTLTREQAEYELARGLIRPVGAVKTAAAQPLRRPRKR